MRAARIHEYGDHNAFRLDDIPIPQPGPGEVLIRLRASSINHFDLALRDGRVSQFVPLEMPAILGGDGAGFVQVVGYGVTDFKPGDRVIADFASNGRGSYAEFATAPVTAVARLPDNVGYEAGATLPKAGLTARGALDQLGIRPGDRVLVSGALGCVGRAAVQYLKEFGAIPVAGVRAERLDEASALAGEALDINRPPLKPTFGIAISTAASAGAATLAHVRDGGRVFAVARLPEGTNVDNRVTVLSGRHRTDARVLRAVAEAAGRGELAIPIVGEFELSQLPEAHRVFAAGVPGKIVLRH